MRAFQELTVAQFRGLKDLSLREFGDINIIVGDNNSGKTSVLEALLLFDAPEDIYHIVRSSRSRIVPRSGFGDSTFNSFLTIFPFDKSPHKIELFANYRGSESHIALTGKVEQRIFLESVEHFSIEPEELFDDDPRETIEVETDCFSGTLSYNSESNGILIRSDHMTFYDMKRRSKIFFISPVQHLTGFAFTRTATQYKEEIVRLLSIFDENIVGLDLVRNDDGFGRGAYEVIHHKKFSKPIPLYTFGDGLRRALMLATSIVQAKNGVLLIDEIESSIHVSVLSEIFAWVVKSAKEYNVQIFASTHNDEAIKKITEIAVEDTSSLVAYRIEKFDGKFYAKRYAEDRLNYVVNEKGQDIR
jgi:predicted ATPase